MADKDDKKIGEELRRITHTGDKNRFPVMAGIVVAGSIDESEMTCTVKLNVSDPENPRDGVMLNAAIENSNGFVLYPADNSWVWVAEIDGPGKWGIIKCSELVKVVCTINNCKLTVTGSGFKMESGGKNLGTVLQNLFTHLQALTVPTGTGPSGVPVNSTDFATDASDLAAILL